MHKQIQELEDKLEQNNEYIDETRRQSSKYSNMMPKRTLNIQELNESPEERKYKSKNSSYLIMKPTPDHSGFDIDNNSSCNTISYLDCQ